MRKLILTLFLLIMMVSCNDRAQVSNTLQNIFIENHSDFIIIVSDKDCNSCLEDAVSKLKKKGSVNGLYFSKFPEEFRQKIALYDTSIIWKQGHDLEILRKVSQDFSQLGPYYYQFKDGKYVSYDYVE